MRENKIFSCYTPFAFSYAEKYFRIGYKETGVIDLLNETLSPRDVISRFMTPMDCCRFCHTDKTDWFQVQKSDLNNTINWSH